MDMNTWNILLVDDEVDFITTLAERLELRGINARVVHDGESALKAVDDNVPQVMVLDVMMPGMDGPQTLEQLVNLVDINVVPVAFMTAKVQPAEVEHYLSLGARDVIIKPFDPMQLASQIRAIWSRSNG